MYNRSLVAGKQINLLAFARLQLGSRHETRLLTSCCEQKCESLGRQDWGYNPRVESRGLQVAATERQQTAGRC